MGVTTRKHGWLEGCNKGGHRRDFLWRESGLYKMSSHAIGLLPLVDVSEAQTIFVQGVAIDFQKHGLVRNSRLAR